MKKQVVLIFLVGLFTNARTQYHASIRETTKSYITYPFSDPDPVPNTGKIYPYFRYDGFAIQPVKRNWKTVVLENEFISVQVMPEIGGKVWNAYDKKNRKYFIYNNDVVKFRDIAMRGPWTSGGLEANFGIIGHTPAVATPVDYLTRQNDDGSVSCFIGTLDLLTRSRWTVEINLPADKAYFITKVYWHNASNIERPYYSWMNLAVSTNDSLHFVDPGSHYIGHDGSASAWPNAADTGTDLSVYDNNAFGADKSYHIFGSLSPYYGAYWKKDDYGMIHYARREEKAGKKIFLWALSDEGRIWEKLLTDTNGQYAEIQSGRLFNQNIPESSETPFRQRTFMPYQTDEWQEYWYPFAGTGGVSHATLNSVIHYSEIGDSLRISVSAVARIDGDLNLLDSTGRMLASKRISILPLGNQVFSFGPETKQFSKISMGGELISRDADIADLDRPVERMSAFDPQSAFSYYLKGRDEARFGMHDSAALDLNKSLSLEPGLLPALAEMALVKYRAMQYDSAVLYSRKALQIDTYEPQANYAYAIASEKIGNTKNAIDGYQIASMNPAYRGPAFTALSRLSLRNGEIEVAHRYATEALKYDADNISALELIYVSNRLSGQVKILDSLGYQIRKRDPLNHFLSFEKFWEKKDSTARIRFVSGIKTELADQTFLELAIWYHSIGLDDEARSLLLIAPQQNEIQYWRAWLEKDTDTKKELLKKANQGDAGMVFPFREESAMVMDWAMKETQDWKPGYYRALIAIARGDRKYANELLKKQDSNITFAPYHVLKAELAGASDSSGIEAHFQKALTLSPNEWRYRKLLSEFYLSHHQPKKAVDLLEKYYKRQPDNYIIGSGYVRALLDMGAYEKAEKILDTITILPFEGARDGRRLYREDKLMLALEAIRKHRFDLAIKKIAQAKEWPTRLGAGKPYPALLDTTLEDNLSQAVLTLRQHSDAKVDLSAIENEIRAKKRRKH